jgi:GntR family phosphonate transport system transcriptional regulator
MSIAASLRAEIAGGIYPTGDRIPTEAALSARFGVNRHTVRQAIAALAQDRIVHTRRGAGVFVTTRPTDYPIGPRVRFHQNLTAAGHIPAKRVLVLETRKGSADERADLELPQGAMVHVYEGISLAENDPVAVFRSVFPATRFPDILKHLEKDPSVTVALRASGLPDYTRARTRINATVATAPQALHLMIREHAPILRTTSINIDSAGTPVEAGVTWFAGDKMTLTLDTQ